MFCHTRTLYLRDTDAAGVAYFASILSICHEAYEASLVAAAVPLSDLLSLAGIAIPIIHAEARFLQPLCCGDTCEVHVIPQNWQGHRFAIAYRIYRAAAGAGSTRSLATTALTQHYCIHPDTRQRQPLPALLQCWYQRWAEASDLGDGADPALPDMPG